MTALSYTSYATVKTRLGLDDDEDETLITSFVNAANDWIETYCWRPVGPNDGGTLTFDSIEDVSADLTTLFVRQGIRTVTSMTVALATGSTPATATTDDLVVLPRVQNRKSGFPGSEIRFKDYIAGSVNLFGRGYGDIVVVGDFGFAAIPEKVRDIAETSAIRWWAGRANGQADIVGSDANGEPIVSRYVSSADKATLRMYRPAGGLVVG